MDILPKKLLIVNTVNTRCDHMRLDF